MILEPMTFRKAMLMLEATDMAVQAREVLSLRKVHEPVTMLAVMMHWRHGKLGRDLVVHGVRMAALAPVTVIKETQIAAHEVHGPHGSIAG